MSGKILLAYSGGIDSTVALWSLRDAGADVECVTVDYGQAARQELINAGELCRRYGVRQHLHTVPNLQRQLAVGVEPFVGRRLVVLSIAAAVAQSLNAEALVFAERLHMAPSRWIHSFANTLSVGSEGRLAFVAPFRFDHRHEIVKHGQRLRAPLKRTFSCFREGVLHCGHCRGCIERQRGFRAAGVPDPTEYECGAGMDVLPFTGPLGPEVDFAA
jgi:7-cyano-7-deazaguanine synthase